jgi:serine/threonine-protein kinase
MSEELAPGARFAQYRIEETVGRGGMGVVHRALDVALRRHVALKVIAPVWSGDERYRSRFLREARSAAAIEHPHIVPLHEAGEHEGRLFIAMRYVGGGDLRSIVRAAGALEPRRAAVLVAQLGSALDAAHARGMAHRDVKPANALLASGTDEADHVYLTDFGVARPVAEHTALTAERGLIGSLAYMAPEVIEGAPGDPAADRYALACTAYELLTGRPPYVGDSDAAVMFGHLNGAPPSVGSAALDEVLAWGLAKAPADRPASCAALADALRAALGTPGSRPGAATVTRSLPLDGPSPLAATAVRPAPTPVPRRLLGIALCLAVGLGAGIALAPSGDHGPFRLRSDVADAQLPGWSHAPVGAGELAGLGMTARD